jgi:outer membrane receptor protein involved in Fe transport
MKTHRLLKAVLFTAASLAAPIAFSDDVADEADLQFELGAEAYRARDFRTALEHFLTSNRLVQNRNVVFNIAKAYEQLGRYADAHRYYTVALAGETDRTALESIQQALARIAPNVAVLRVASDPPGATIFIDRRDLGPRGTAPRAMAFAPGRYTVIAELEGYEPATSAPTDLRLGQEATVALRMVPILGTVHVQSDVASAVRVDNETAEVRCTSPCDLQLSPGRHRLFLTAEGYQPFVESVDVVARSNVDARVRMAPVTGSVVVSADERDALVEVDGRAMGFTPAVLNVQVGTRRVRISLPGFRAIERVVDVRGSAEQRVEVALTRVEEVSAASRSAESVEDAPSSVTVIPAQELRAMGYPTISEAIRGVRGVYLNDDRSYESAGFRGFGRPGDYGNRVLVLLDGHPTNDNWLNSSYIGYDARTDLEDVERIEVVRGPGSVLYGTGAFSGVINVVTRGRNTPRSVEAGLSTNQYGVARARVAGRWGNSTAGVWASAGGAYGGGRDFYFPELVQPAMATLPASDGNSRNADGFTAGTFTGRAWWRDLTLQWLVHSRDKSVPTGEYDTLVGNDRTNLVDTRGLLELRFEPHITDTLQVNLRAFGNYYDYRSQLATSVVPEEDGLESFRGMWAGIEARAVWTQSSAFRLTVGSEGQFHFMANQQSGTLRQPGRNLSQSNRYQIVAGYLSADGSPVPWFRYSVAGRVDWYSTLSSPAFNPRVALIFRPYARGNLKIMGGTAFRAPSIYELYYTSTTQAVSNGLKPETIYSGEIEFSHRVSTTWTAVASTYVNYIRNLVALRQMSGAMGLEQYQNTDAPVLTFGAEAEVRREWRQGWMLSASYSFQRSQYLETGGADVLREVPNSPEHLFSLRASAPVVAGVFIATTRVAVEGPRWDRNDRASDPAQQRTRTALIWDIVASGRAERWGLRYAVGVYNLFDWRYAVPVSAEYGERLTSVPQNGRTFMASTSLEF